MLLLRLQLLPRALSYPPGVFCKLRGRTVHVLYKEGVQEETLRAAVTGAGYTVG